MERLRTTLHRGKEGFAKHNVHKHLGDKRNVSTLAPISREKGDSDDLYKLELRFYERYAEALEKQNEKYREKRNYDRLKTLEEFYLSDKYKPTEEIMQLGCVGSEVPDKKTFNSMILEYVNWKLEWSEAHGGHLKVLNASNHFDEATPHSHVREIWEYTDSDGLLKIGQEKAMELSGIELPNPGKKRDRYNNRAITYTRMCRDKWNDICESYGYTIEREPLVKSKKHETVSEYSMSRLRDLQEREKALEVSEREAKERLDDLNAQIRSKIDEKASLDLKVKKYSDEHEKRLKNDSERLQRLNNATDELDKAIKRLNEAPANITIQVNDKRLLEFVKQRKYKDGSSVYDKFIDWITVKGQEMALEADKKLKLKAQQLANDEAERLRKERAAKEKKEAEQIKRAETALMMNRWKDEGYEMGY